MVMSTYNNSLPVSPYKTTVCCVYSHCDAQPSFSVPATLQETLTECRIWRGKPVEANRLCTLGRLSRWVSRCYLTTLQPQATPACGGIQRADALTVGRPRPNEGLRYLGNGTAQKRGRKSQTHRASLTI